MSIINLREEPQHIQTLAEWHHAEWSHLNSGGSVAKRIKKMQSYLTVDFIPSTYVYKRHGEVAGSAAIVLHDMDSRPDLSPWLASVYVSAQHRDKGVGSKLVSHVMQEARSHGVDRLYLFTDSKHAFYEKLGWSICSREVYRGCKATIMEANLQV